MELKININLSMDEFTTLGYLVRRELSSYRRELSNVNNKIDLDKLTSYQRARLSMLSSLLESFKPYV